jgi:alanyl-tRNA synthetase
MQVIADHARATTFLIADGVLPSNEWRGYVLRRIMRRAMRHGRKLGLTEPFLWRGVEWVGEVMGRAYPEIVREHRRLTEVVRQEEEQFARTLDQGMRRLEEFAQTQGAGRGRPIDGRLLFTLYDTYGFPRDLAEEVLVDQGWRATDETERAWSAEMEAQRERARAKAAFGGDEDASDTVALYQQIGGSLARPQQFIGYETLTAPATILAMVAEGRRVREAATGDEVEIILDRTPGYAESGGQIGDRGSLVGRAGRAEIVDTYYRGSKLIVHRVKVAEGGFHENEDVAVTIDSPRRQGLRQHHTGTHLLHAALRRVLGTHVAQAGSLVAPDHLRFDFSHGSGVKDREIEQIEELVNEQVQANIPVTNAEMNLKEALAAGAMALFGEKYGERVRVVKIGDFSTELCGGTHLDATGQIGFFKVAEEGAVASGVRRIEAVAGTAAVETVARRERVLREIADILKVGADEAPQRLRKLLDEQKLLERQLAEMETKLARGKADDLVASARQVNGVAVVAGRIDGLDPDGLRAVADTLRDRLGSGVVCVGSVLDGKVNLVAAVTKDLVKRFPAGKLIQEVAQAAGGRGGGRPDLAQAGAPDPGRLDAALALVADWVGRQG